MFFGSYRGSKISFDRLKFTKKFLHTIVIQLTKDYDIYAQRLYNYF